MQCTLAEPVENLSRSAILYAVASGTRNVANVRHYTLPSTVYTYNGIKE